MRALPFVVLALLPFLADCHRDLPAWSRASSGIRGESTIAGEPARVGRFATPPLIDGKLDEAAWQAAVALGPFVDTFTGKDAPDGYPVHAFARVGWDEAKLYLGFVVRDREPVAPFGRDQRDPHVWGRSSAVEIMVQPGAPGDNRDYYEIQIDTAGAIFDTHWDDYNAPRTGSGPATVFGHQEWSCQAERAAFVQRGAFYSIEVAIPWSAFSPGRTPIPPHPGDVWRLELYSFRDGQRHALGWSPIRGLGNFHRSTRFGRMRFD